MTATKLLFSLMSAVVTSLLWITPAHAQATRTWVSGVGDDANPCSRTAPCKTFAGAISKTAAGGEINALDPAGYGAVTITKSITIDGGGGQVASILTAGGTNAIIVNAGAGDIVTIRNLTIQGLAKTASPALNGIRFLAGAALHVENVSISGFSQYGIDFAPTTSSEIYLDDLTVHEAGAVGITLRPAGGATVRAMLERVRITNSLAGLRVSDGVRASVIDSVVSGSSNNGVEANSTSTTATINLDRSLVSGNGYGVVASGPNGVVRLSDVGIYDNDVGMAALSAGFIVTYANNRNAGNGTPGTPSSRVTDAVPSSTTSTAFHN